MPMILASQGSKVHTCYQVIEAWGRIGLDDRVHYDARQAGQKAMRVYTLAFLDHLAPGLILYLKSRVTVETEYLQLQKKISHWPQGPLRKRRLNVPLDLF